MELWEKLEILGESAKYDVSCSSSGIERGGKKGALGSAAAPGICHSFSADGRCISLLKVLLTNSCVYDCKYCINRRSNEIRRAAFTPRELAELMIGFYRRNYIEGLFLSSGVLKDPNYTCEQMIETLSLLRNEYRFNGYIHAKAIPGADPVLLGRLGELSDRMSVNIELPSQRSLTLLAPDKKKEMITVPMRFISRNIAQNTTDLVRYRSAKPFVPAGQSTQMIIGATPETDYQVLLLTQALYKKYQLKRVYFSAYTPVISDALLPAATDFNPPMLREHRLYQADWLLRFYQFEADEILDEAHPSFHPLLDPKCNWAVNHLDRFPIEINTIPYEQLLRIPGVGVKSARRIIEARRVRSLDFDGLKRIGVVLKRARYFITCNGKMLPGIRFSPEGVTDSLISEQEKGAYPLIGGDQISLFERSPLSIREDVMKCISGQI